MGAPALLALLCVAQASSGRGVQASADLLTITPSTRAWVFSGHATLRSQDLVLRADEIGYDPDAERARAQGNVVFSSGLFGGTATGLDLDLAHETGLFQGATLYAKSRAKPAEIAAARTPAQMHLVGKNDLTLRADELHRLGNERFDARGLYLTPCDCKAPDWFTEPPSWSVRARAARIDAGHSARLTWATLYIKDVPVLPVPLLLLPLSNRQTGFLLPHPFYSSRNGFQLEEPFFWAISRSYDATFTPGYFFGSSSSDTNGMRGPRLGTEVRYVPSTETHGRLNLALVEDFKSKVSDPHPGMRGELSFTHVQELGRGWEDRVDAAALSDESYFSDVTADVVAQQASYLRSDARVDRRGEETDLFLTGSYYQALQGTGGLRDPSGNPVTAGLNPFFGPRNVNRYTFQRLPAFGFSLLERALGPLRARLDVDGASYAPLSSGPQPTCDPFSPDPSCVLLAQRQPSQRVGLQPSVRLPLLLGRYAELDPYLLLRGDAWYVEPRAGADAGSARALAVVGAQARTELARTFGSGDSTWRHALTPVLELRALPWSSGALPAVNGSSMRPNDEFDAPTAAQTGAAESHPLCAPAPAGPLTGAAQRESPQLFQGIAALRTRLQHKAGGAVTEPVSAEVGQGYDFACRQPADSYARAAFQSGPLSASGELRYSWAERRLAALSARAAWNTPAGSSLSVGYSRLRSFLTDPMNAGVLDLVGPPGPQGGTSADPAVLAERLDVGARLRASPALGLELGATFLPHASLLDAFSTAAAAERTPPWARLLQYTAGVSYGSPCDCWGLRAFGLFQPAQYRQHPWVPASFFFVLDAHRLGGNFGS